MHRKSRFSPGLDALEVRNLLSTVAAGVNLVGSTVEVGGVSGANQTTVFTKSPGVLAVAFNGQEFDFNASQVSRVDFQDNGAAGFNFDYFVNFANVDVEFHGGHFVNCAYDYGTGSATFSDDAAGAYVNIFAGLGGGRDDFTSNGRSYIFYEDTGAVAVGYAPASYHSAS